MAATAKHETPQDVVQRLLDELQANVMKGLSVKQALAHACTIGIELGRSDSEERIKIVGPGRTMFQMLAGIEQNINNGKTSLARGLAQACANGLEMTSPEEPSFEIQVARG